MPHRDRPSQAFLEILNLAEAASDHKSMCHDECAVSIYRLRITAERLLPLVNADEYARARDLVKDWPV